MAIYSDNGVDKALESLLPAFGYACDVGPMTGSSTATRWPWRKRVGWSSVSRRIRCWRSLDGRGESYGGPWLLGTGIWTTLSSISVVRCLLGRVDPRWDLGMAEPRLTRPHSSLYAGWTGFSRKPASQGSTC